MGSCQPAFQPAGIQPLTWRKLSRVDLAFREGGVGTRAFVVDWEKGKHGTSAGTTKCRALPAAARSMHVRHAFRIPSQSSQQSSQLRLTTFHRLSMA